MSWMCVFFLPLFYDLFSASVGVQIRFMLNNKCTATQTINNKKKMSGTIWTNRKIRKEPWEMANFMWIYRIYIFIIIIVSRCWNRHQTKNWWNIKMMEQWMASDIWFVYSTDTCNKGTWEFIFSVCCWGDFLRLGFCFALAVRVEFAAQTFYAIKIAFGKSATEQYNNDNQKISMQYPFRV